MVMEVYQKPKRSRVAVVLLGMLIPAGVFGLIWMFFLGPKMHHDRLVKNGVHVPGRLLDVDETGTYVNDAPELELTIEFTRRDGTLDTASTDFIPTLRTLHFYQPGTSITAAYDSTNPEEITIVSLNAPDPGASMPANVQNASQDSLRRVVDSLRDAMEKMKAAGK